MKKISIIVRTKNEEKWIGACLRSVFEQQKCDFEVIIVDDKSQDQTLEIVSKFPVKLVNYNGSYLPGNSLNTGIRQSEGEYLAILSGHCIPVNQHWLHNMLRNFNDPKIAAVYGRQEPLPYSSDTDKRDLWTVFGLDRKVQKKDSFFHNANSMIRRDIWDKIPFDENTTNIEDRIWAKSVLQDGYHVVYDPEASVYHWHGIHQDGNEERLRNVVRIVESLELINANDTNYKETSELNITAIIPKKGESLRINGKSLMEYTIERASESELVNQVVVSTDSEKTADMARSLGASVPFLRPKELSYDYIGLNRVMSYTISQLHIRQQIPDIVLILQETNPFRPKGFLDEMIREMLYSGVDTLIPVRKDYNIFFRQEKNDVVPIDKGLIPQKFKEPLFAGIAGLGMLVKPLFLKDQQLTGNNIGVFPVKHRLSPLEIQSASDANYFSKLLKRFWESNE
jgi:CMP-N-acetylneuraminic acid synthetase/GT2 family glycosyltransferase